MTVTRADDFAHARAAAGVLFFDERDRVLLVVPSYKDYRDIYKDYRDIPGGYVEHGETPTQAAAREVHEELGITPPIGRLLVADWAPDQTDGDKLLFIFDGGVLDDHYRNKIRFVDRELTAYEFHDIANMHELTIVRLARRVVQAHAAHHDGSTRYLENGQPIAWARP